MNHHFKAVQYTSLKPGIKLIVTGAVHGNEKCGTKAIVRVIEDIESGRLNITTGQVSFIPITNPMAYLNRNLKPVAQPQYFEDHIANWLCPLLAKHDVLLDLHSTRASNPPFATHGSIDSGPDGKFKHLAAERALAHRLGINRFVEGWMSTYASGVARRIAYAKANGLSTQTLDTDPSYGIGTTEYIRSQGGYAITLECGQHDDPLSPDVGYRAILNALAHLGISDGPLPATATQIEHLRLYDVIDRQHADDRFTKVWSSFNAVSKGELIGARASGEEVLADSDGYIVFPDANSKPGFEWFYLAKAVAA
jgi:predicted deacylase